MRKQKRKKDKRRRNPVEVETDEAIDKALEPIEKDGRDSQATKEFLESLKRHATGVYRALEKLLKVP